MGGIGISREMLLCSDRHCDRCEHRGGRRGTTACGLALLLWQPNEQYPFEVESYHIIVLSLEHRQWLDYDSSPFVVRESLQEC